MCSSDLPRGAKFRITRLKAAVKRSALGVRLLKIIKHLIVLEMKGLRVWMIKIGLSILCCEKKLQR